MSKLRALDGSAPLVALIQKLALSPARQATLFPSPVWVPDEFADDLEVALDALAISPEDLPTEVREIVRLFDLMTGLPECWENRALFENINWERIRRLAQSVLSQEGIPPFSATGEWERL